MNNKLLLLLSLALFFSACKTTKQATNSEIKTLSQIDVIGKKSVYRGSEQRDFDLIHTKLNVSFSWEDQFLFGEATLDLKPYFYPQNILELDAKGMDIKEVSIITSDSTKKKLDFTYDKLILKIDLDKTYERTEKIKIYIKYISKPNELEKTEGLSAISDDKGLYFINPLGEDPEKPRQIWTQGEPESNSVWFPTIDHPNERCTQEISITIENKYTALSNGYVDSQVFHEDGTYTITWKQDKPHAPYLFMMAIGEYAEVKDSWKAMTVNYYVEKDYEKVAKRIFGKTPRMLQFFSDKLIEYPWDKYWQVIVRDYVSGAMENTTSVIFGEFVQRNERELLDEDHEDIIAHELFHHWFGDYVTCESWSNLPLNESFATYGEVLWAEHEYGDNAKYLKVKQDMDGYFREAKSGKQVDLIRFNYDSPEEMFDGHSYAKGGVVLNMLRTVVGDDAFFTSLQNYLHKNRNQSVEIHDLRIAFEETTGKDMNWFFNQWFLSSGHPIIDVNYVYTDSSVIVKLNQEASNEDYLVYRLPLDIDITVGYTTIKHHVIFDKKHQEFVFPTTVKPELVNVDAQHYLLAEFKDTKTEENYVVQYNNAKNLMDKVQALDYFNKMETKTPNAKMIFNKAISDDFWYIQNKGLHYSDPKDLKGRDLNKVMELTQKAQKTSVQAKALEFLAKLEDKKYESIFERGLQSKSYRVNAAALNGLFTTNPDKALKIAEEWEHIENYDIKDQVGYIYSETEDTLKAKYFQNQVEHSKMKYADYYSIYHYSIYLGKINNDKTVLEGISFIENWGLNDKEKFSVNVAKSALIRVSNTYTIKADSYKSEISNSTGMTSSQVTALENEYANLVFILERINEATENLNNKQEKK